MSSDGCARFRAELDAFVGGELREARHAAVQEHLRGCVACRREAGELQQAAKALRLGASAAERAVERAQPDLHEDLHAAILRRVAELEAVQQAASPARRPRIWLLAAAVLMAAVGYWLTAADGESIWNRPGQPAPRSSDVLRAVPWAGPRLDLRPVGFDEYGSAESGFGPGMMGRGQLRAAVDPELVLPEAAEGGR